jgi:hypothetical protein
VWRRPFAVCGSFHSSLGNLSLVSEEKIVFVSISLAVSVGFQALSTAGAAFVALVTEKGKVRNHDLSSDVDMKGLKITLIRRFLHVWQPLLGLPQ